MRLEDSGYIELAEGTPRPPDLVQRVTAGELFVMRGCAQRIGLQEELMQASLEGVKRVLGSEIAETVAREGFEKIHDVASLEQIAAITDAIYDVTAPKAAGWVATIMPSVLGVTQPYYFERRPNIRFVIPFDLMMKDADVVAGFSSKHGRGKITPHPPHRDSWMDCPANTINVWIALGPIPEGNGITIFPDAFTRNLAHVSSGGLARDENPGKPVNFDLAAGDAILFQGDHLHASVLNRTDVTRHAISFRVVVEKPQYVDKHYHHYAYSSLAGGALDMFAEVPGMDWGWLRTRLVWAGERLGVIRKGDQSPKQAKRVGTQLGGERVFDLSRIAVDSLQPVSEDVCVARIGEDEVVAFGRRCPHEGADLALGYVSNGEVVCPWHDVRFDSTSGKTACQSLKGLRFFETRVADGKVTVNLESRVR